MACTISKGLAYIITLYAKTSLILFNKSFHVIHIYAGVLRRPSFLRFRIFNVFLFWSFLYIPNALLGLIHEIRVSIFFLIRFSSKLPVSESWMSRY